MSRFLLNLAYLSNLFMVFPLYFYKQTPDSASESNCVTSQENKQKTKYEVNLLNICA